ncbi:ABC transporter substrate-binding protein [Gloeobacter kilaueensis]|nr:ABC transporter substrate-binding protein [Gloeobacter kilaueensis]
MFSKSRWDRRRVLALAGLALTGCAGQARTSRPVATTVGIVDWVGYAPLYVAAQKGFFAPLGLDLVARTFPSPGQGTLAFAGGRVEAAADVTAGAVDLKARGKDFRVVMVVDRSLGADGLLASNHIGNIADLKGHKVALEYGSVSHFFFLQVLAQAGLGSQDVTIVNTPPDAAAAAYRSGQVEAAVSYAPFLGAANRARPDGRILFDSSRLPSAISDIYLFDAGYIKIYPEKVQAFVTGVLRGLAYLEAHPDEGYAITARQIKIQPSEVKTYLQGIRLADLATNIDMLTNPNSPVYLLGSMRLLARFLKDQGQIQAIPDLDNLIDPRFVLAARSNPS